MNDAAFKNFVYDHGRAFRGKVHPVAHGPDEHARNRVADYPVSIKEDVLPKGLIRLEVDEAALLYSVAANAEFGVVEIGRLAGGSTFLLAHAQRRLPIYSLDVAPKDDAALKGYFAKVHLGANVTLAVGDSASGPSHEVDPAACGRPYDVLFVDGDHDFEGCFNDLTLWAGRMLINSHVLVHDCAYGAKPTVVAAVAAFLRKNPSWEAVRGPFTPYGGDRHSWGGTMAHLWKRG